MKGFMLIAMMTLSCFSSVKISRGHNYGRNQPRNLDLSLENENEELNRVQARKLLEGQPGGNVYVEQLQNTNSNLNEMQSHAKRQSEMKQVGQWFSDIDERLDDFRDTVARKLNELHMALQRPKVPMFHQFGGNAFAAASRLANSIASPGGYVNNLPELGASLSGRMMKDSL